MRNDCTEKEPEPEIMTSSELAFNLETFAVQLSDSAHQFCFSLLAEAGSPKQGDFTESDSPPRDWNRWAWNLGWELGKQAATSQWERPW